MHQIDGITPKSGYLGLFHHKSLLKSLAIGLFIVFITPFIYSTSAHATQTVPYKINFQGRLTDSSGNIKPDGVYSMKFRLYSAATSGTLLWTETRDHTSGQQVTVTNGLFSVQLGDVAALDPAMFSSGSYPIYLEVELPTPATATCTSNGCETWTEGPMSPRSPFGSSGYAFNADQIDGIDGSDLVVKTADNTLTGQNTFNGQVTLNNTTTLSNNGLLGINIQGTAGSYTLQNDGIGAYLYSDDTSVHLGVTQYGTSGTSVNTNGDGLLIVTSAADDYASVVRSGVLDSGSLIDNGSFESGCAGWIGTCAVDKTVAHYGNNSGTYVQAVGTDSSSIQTSMIAAAPGQYYYAEGWMRTTANTTGTALVSICYFDKDAQWLGNCTNGSASNPDTTWTKYTVTGQAPANTKYIQVKFFVEGNGSTGGTWYFDDLSVLRTDHSESNVYNADQQFNYDVNLANYAYIDWNKSYNGSSYVVQDAGATSSIFNEADTGFNLKVSSYKSAGTVLTDAQQQTLLVGYAPTDNVAGLIDNGVTYGANLVSNPSFEFGCAGWIACFSATATDDPYSGLSEYKYTMPTTASTYDITSRKVAVKQGDQLYTSIKIKTSATTTGQGGLYVHFYDASGVGLGTGAEFSDGDYSNPGTSWATKSWVHTVPAGAAYASLSLTVRGDLGAIHATTTGTWKFDDVTMYAVNRTGPATFRSDVNGADAFQVQDAGQNTVFGVDTALNSASINAINGRTLPSLTVNQASTGDATLAVSNASSTFSIGVDASDGSKLKIGTYATTTVAGVKTYSNDMDSNNGNTMMAELVQAPRSGTVSKLSLHIGGVATGNTQAAIYTDNGSKTAPGTLMASSASVAVSSLTNSWVDFTITGQSVTAGTYYWLVFNQSSDTTQENYAYQTDGVTQKMYKTGQSFGTWAGSWPVGGVLEPHVGFGMTMEIAAGIATDSFATSALSVDTTGNVMLQSSADSAHAFQIQQTSGVTLLNADTANGEVTVAKVDDATTAALKVYQGGFGDASLAVTNSYEGFNFGLDGGDNTLKIGTFGSGTSGVTTPSGNMDSGNADFLICTAIEARTTGYVSTLRMHLGAVSGHMKMAIYDDNGTRNRPVNLMSNSASISLATPNAWQDFPLASTVSVTAGQVYWLCFNADSNTTEEDFSDFGKGTIASAYKPTTYSTSFGTNPLSGGSFYIDTGWAVNMDISQSTSSDQFAASPFRMGIGGETIFRNIANSDSAFSVQSSSGQELLSLDTARMGVTIKGESGVLDDTDQRVTLLTVDGSSMPIYRNDVNGIQVKYAGGIATEGAGMRIDYVPGDGSNSSGTWDGLRIVAAATGATTGTTSYGIKLEGPTSPGAGQETAQYIGTGWDLGIDIQSGGLQLASQSDPTAPASGNLKIYAKDLVGGKSTLAIRDTSGTPTTMQSSLMGNRVALATPGPSGTAQLFGTTINNVGGTVATPSLTSTSKLTSTRTMTYSTTASSGSVVSQRQNTQWIWLGNGTGLGGFLYETRFGLSATQFNNRAFVGLSDFTGTLTNVDPTTDKSYSKIGMATNTSTGNWSFVTNASGGSTINSQTLGSSVPVNTTDLYDLIIYCPPNGSTIYYKVTNLTTGNTSSGSSSSSLPSNTAFMMPTLWLTNNTINAIATLNWAGWYAETDN